MSSELLYTSAPKGLRQGSRGFCTVISSSGMPSNLATKLESLSGYRQMFAPESPEANQNPIAYSHMTVTIGGQVTSVLSRISAYGTDYSGRTNKLAHHVVPARSEMPPAGPAWLLQQPGLMRTQWDGNCQTTAAGPAISMGNLTAGKCNTWQQLAGDAAWAAALADAWSQRQSKPLWIVYRLEQAHQLLSLLSEATALLPESERWKATFNTYATQLPPDVQCRVRCVVEGTQDARMAKAKGTVITLGQANGPAPTNDWSEIARGNQAPAPSPQPTPAQSAAGVGTGKTPPRKSPPTKATKIPGLPPGKTHAQPAHPQMPTAAEGTTPAHPAGSGAEPPAMRPPLTVDPQDYNHGSRGLEVIEPGPSPLGPFNQEPKRPKAPLLAAIAVVLIALIVGATTFVLQPNLIASLFPAPAENTEEGPETNEGSGKKDTKKKGKGADSDKNKNKNKNKNKEENGKSTAKSTPPPLPKLTVAIKANGNEPFKEGDTCEEGDTLTVRVTRDNKESGDERIITLSNDEKDARVSFAPTEIKFNADEDSKEIELKIKNDEEFNPAELTITAQYQESDKAQTETSGHRRFLISDTNDLKIAFKDENTDAVIAKFVEGKSYRITPTPTANFTFTFDFKPHPPKDENLPESIKDGDIFEIKTTEEETSLSLKETFHAFKKGFLKIGGNVIYKHNDRTLAKKPIDDILIQDNDDPTRILRWGGLNQGKWINANKTSATGLLDESKPNIAANKDKGKQPHIIWETNEWPAPAVEAKTSGLSEDKIKLSSRGGKPFSLKTKQKTGQEHIIVKVFSGDEEYDAHLFSNEDSARAYIKNPNAPSQPPSQDNSQEQLAFVNVDQLMGRTSVTPIINLKAYQIIFDEKINPFEPSFKLKLTPPADGRPQFSSDNADLKAISKLLNSFRKQTDPAWSDNPLTEKCNIELETPFAGLRVIADKGKCAIGYEFKINRKQQVSNHQQLSKLYGTRNELKKLMNHNAKTLVSQLSDDAIEKQRFINALEGLGSKVTVGEGKDKQTNKQGKLAPPDFLVNLRKHFFETITSDLTWNNLQLKKSSFTWTAFERESKKHDSRMESFTKYKLSNGVVGQSNEYKKVTEKQMQTITRKIEVMQQAINDIEKSPPFDLKKTLVVEQDGKEILKIPLNFTLKFE